MASVDSKSHTQVLMEHGGKWPQCCDPQYRPWHQALEVSRNVAVLLAGCSSRGSGAVPSEDAAARLERVVVKSCLRKRTQNTDVEDRLARHLAAICAIQEAHVFVEKKIAILHLVVGLWGGRLSPFFS